MFYRSYRITLKVGRRADPFPSLGLIGMLLIINGLTIFNLSGWIFDITLDQEIKSYALEAFTIGGGILYFLFRYLVVDERRLAIFREFDTQTNKQKWIMNICVIIYLILTVFLFDYSLDLIGVP